MPPLRASGPPATIRFCRAAEMASAAAQPRECSVMSEGIEETELVEVEQRAARASAIAPTPWVAQLETRGGLGGESFIRLGDDPALD